MTISFVTLVLICIVCMLSMSCALWRRSIMAHRIVPASASFIDFFEKDGNGSEDDDSDIKIAGAEPVKSTDDALVDATELESQRCCGNLEKAHNLGASLSLKIISEDGESTFGQDCHENILMRRQRRLLLAFSAVNTVEESIKSKVLQGVVLNVFYNALQKSLPGFYDDISKSGSFSFYTLCVRRGGDVESSIGNTFAMLVGKDGDTVMEELGKALYLRFEDVTLKAIKSFDFKQ